MTEEQTAWALRTLNNLCNSGCDVVIGIVPEVGVKILFTKITKDTVISDTDICIKLRCSSNYNRFAKGTHVVKCNIEKAGPYLHALEAADLCVSQLDLLCKLPEIINMHIYLKSTPVINEFRDIPLDHHLSDGVIPKGFYLRAPIPLGASKQIIKDLKTNAYVDPFETIAIYYDGFTIRGEESKVLKQEQV